MGLRFRRSVNVGLGFRINFSQSGIGYSWGVPGYRITKTATGQIRRTYSLPGTGISYVEQSTKRSEPNLPQHHATQQDVSEHNKFSLTDESELRNSSQAELIKRINENTHKFNFTWLFALCFFIFALSTYPFIGQYFPTELSFLIQLSISVFLLVLLALINRYFRNKKTFSIDYDLDENTLVQFDNFIRELSAIGNSQRLWLINHSVSLNTIHQIKANAGANNLLRRTIMMKPTMLDVGTANALFFIRANVKSVVLKFAGTCLLFLPEVALLKTGKNVIGLSYDNIKIASGTTRFIEEEGVPSDSVVVDYTWKFVNKNGSPDRRYNNNRKLPICQYGTFSITSEKGLMIEIHTSNSQMPDKVRNAISFYTTYVNDALLSAK